MASLAAAYRRLMTTRPLLGQMLSAGVIGTAGDFLCQLTVDRRSLREYDVWRGVRFFALPALYIVSKAAHVFLIDAFYSRLKAPALTVWFRVLERVPGRSAKLLPLKRVVIDQACFAPFFSASIIYILRLMELYTPQEAWTKLREDYWSIYKRSILYWPLVQLGNFYFVPSAYRVVIVQIAALAWNVFLSSKTQAKWHDNDAIPPLE